MAHAFGVVRTRAAPSSSQGPTRSLGAIALVGGEAIGCRLRAAVWGNWPGPRRRTPMRTHRGPPFSCAAAAYVRSRSIWTVPPSWPHCFSVLLQQPKMIPFQFTRPFLQRPGPAQRCVYMPLGLFHGQHTHTITRPACSPLKAWAAGRTRHRRIVEQAWRDDAACIDADGHIYTLSEC
jgi:hypothetical protein